jgi:hypothetical protein
MKHLLSSLAVLFVGCVARSAQTAQPATFSTAPQSPERQFGAGVMMGSNLFAGSAVSAVYAFSPNIHAGLAFGVQSSEGLNRTSQLFIGPFCRVLLPIGSTGLSPFFTITYYISQFSNVSAAIGIVYSLNQRVNIIGQLNPVRFGLRADTASFNREQFVPVTSWNFPSTRIGVEFYF